MVADADAASAIHGQFRSHRDRSDLVARFALEVKPADELVGTYRNGDAHLQLEEPGAELGAPAAADLVPGGNPVTRDELVVHVPQEQLSHSRPQQAQVLPQSKSTREYVAEKANEHAPSTCFTFNCPGIPAVAGSIAIYLVFGNEPCDEPVGLWFLVNAVGLAFFLVCPAPSPHPARRPATKLSFSLRLLCCSWWSASSRLASRPIAARCAGPKSMARSCRPRPFRSRSTRA